MSKNISFVRSLHLSLPDHVHHLKSFETAWRTLQGFEVMNMIRKGQVQGVVKGDVKGQVELVARLFGAAV